MRRFLLKTGLWMVVLLVPMLVIEQYLQRNKDYMKYLIGPEVFTALTNSKTSSGKSVLILGDSVCNQLYPSDEVYPNAVSLACNRALTVAGHYFLMKNYVSANQEALPDTVVLILTPYSVQNQLDRFAYHYMLKNFLTKEYKGDFNDELWTQVRKIPVYWTAPLPFIRVSNYSPEYNPEPDDSFVLFSPISRTYLTRISELADSIHARFFFYCPPVDAGQRDKWEQAFEESAKREEVPEALFEEYTGSVEFVEDVIHDRLHFREDCIPEDYFHLISDKK